MPIPKHILPVIVISQFCCTSLWFAGNGVISDLISSFHLNNNALGHLTIAVQVGFIVGTLVFSLLTIADRFAPSKVFMISALLGAFFNFVTIYPNNQLFSLVGIRFLTGFFLAGIYPVGMKIAADYFEKGLGKSLGFLVGALVLGTAFPHLLKEISYLFAWQSVITTTSVLATLGGILMFLLVPNGPYRKPSQKLDLKSITKIFQHKKFRAAAFGYFGHMWELYAFWAFVPFMLNTYNHLNLGTLTNIPLLSFLIIAIGGIACIVSGYLSLSIGTKKTAFYALVFSGLCCFLSPIFFTVAPVPLFLGFLFFWSFMVIADSPLLSTLVAQNATPQLKGTALTIVTCMGYFISTLSIQFINTVQHTTDSQFLYLVLGIGPIIGILALRKSNMSTV